MKIKCGFIINVLEYKKKQLDCLTITPDVDQFLTFECSLSYYFYKRNI